MFERNRFAADERDKQKRKKIIAEREYIGFDLALMDGAPKGRPSTFLTDSSQMHRMSDRQFIADVLAGKITAEVACAAYRGALAAQKAAMSRAYLDHAPVYDPSRAPRES